MAHGGVVILTDFADAILVIDDRAEIVGAGSNGGRQRNGVAGDVGGAGENRDEVAEANEDVVGGDDRVGGNVNADTGVGGGIASANVLDDVADAEGGAEVDRGWAGDVADGQIGADSDVDKIAPHDVVDLVRFGEEVGVIGDDAPVVTT